MALRCHPAPPPHALPLHAPRRRTARCAAAASASPDALLIAGPPDLNARLARSLPAPLRWHCAACPAAAPQVATRRDISPAHLRALSPRRCRCTDQLAVLVLHIHRCLLVTEPGAGGELRIIRFPPLKLSTNARLAHHRDAQGSSLLSPRVRSPQRHFMARGEERERVCAYSAPLGAHTCPADSRSCSVSLLTWTSL